MFKIPSNTEYILPNSITDNQKIELCKAISEFVTCYLSDNRLPASLKSNIELDNYQNIVYNLSNNQQLLKDVINNNIPINELPWYEPHKLDNKLWKVHIDKRKKNQETREMMATVNIFKCRKCGEKKCTTYQLQTASIDEPMTTYISCKVCGNSWKS